MFSLVNRLNTALDGSSLRHKVLSDNIANVNTPQFKRSDVNFMEALSCTPEKARLNLARTHPKHLTGRAKTESKFRIETDFTTTMRNDTSNVDIEREMTLLTENQLYYTTITDNLSRRLGLLRSVIGEGRR